MFFSFPSVEKQRQLSGSTQGTKTVTMTKTERFFALSRGVVRPCQASRAEEEREERAVPAVPRAAQRPDPHAGPSKRH